MKKIARHSTALFLFATMVYFVRGQGLQTTIKIQAMEMAKALIKNDFTSFIKYIPPRIIEYAGGREKLRSIMDSADAAMKQFSVSFKKILIGNPGEIISYKNQLQCVVPQSTDMQSLLGEIQGQTSLVAISTDHGRNWYFVDTNIYKADKLKNILPDLSPDLVIPPQQPPKFIPNKDQ
jgi:hypothetical protein